VKVGRKKQRAEYDEEEIQRLEAGYYDDDDGM
jgi:hypothetical protein